MYPGSTLGIAILASFFTDPKWSATRHSPYYSDCKNCTGSGDFPGSISFTGPVEAQQHGGENELRAGHLVPTSSVRLGVPIPSTSKMAQPPWRIPVIGIANSGSKNGGNTSSLHESKVHAILTAKKRNLSAGPLAQSVELCTYEVDSRYARVPSSILGGSTALFVLAPSSPFNVHVQRRG